MEEIYIYMVFVNLEKAFYRVPREVILRSLRRKGVLEREIKAIMEMYTNLNIKTSYQGGIPEIGTI